MPKFDSSIDLVVTTFCILSNSDRCDCSMSGTCTQIQLEKLRSLYNYVLLSIPSNFTVFFCWTRDRSNDGGMNRLRCRRVHFLVGDVTQQQKTIRPNPPLASAATQGKFKQIPKFKFLAVLDLWANKGVKCTTRYTSL